MIRVLITVLSFLAVPVTLYGVATIVRPFWLVKRRWQGVVLVLVSFLLIGLLQSVPPSRPADVGPTEWAERLRICKAANDPGACAHSSTEAAAARQKPVQIKAPAAPSSAAASDPKHRDAAASFRVSQAALLASFPPCDTAIEKASRARGRYASYNGAVTAKQACWSAAKAAGAVEFGDPIPADAQKDLNKAVQCFQFALGAKAQAMEDAVRIFDTADQRPSSAGNFQTDMRDALQRDRECAQQYSLAAARHGFMLDLPGQPKAPTRRHR